MHQLDSIENILSYSYPINKTETSSKKKNVTSLMRQTKNIILADKKYKNYINKYNNITQISSFKLPEITNYPVYIENQLVPLTKQSLILRKPAEKNKIRRKVNNLFKSIENPKDNQQSNRKVKLKLSEKHYFSSLEQFETYPIDTLDKTCSYFAKTPYQNSVKKFIYSDSSLNKQTYNTIENEDIDKYGEMSDKEISHFLTRHITCLKENIKINETSVLSKTTNSEKIGFPMHLNLNSMIIRWNKVSDTSEKSTQLAVYNEIKIPLHLLPLLYSVNKEQFLYILSKIVEINPAGEIIGLDYDDLSDLILDLDILNSENPKLSLNSRFNNLGGMKLDWIIDAKHFTATIFFPCVDINIESKLLTKFLEPKFIIGLIESALVNWEVKLVNYLLDNYLVRNKINELFSKCSSKFTKTVKLYKSNSRINNTDETKIRGTRHTSNKHQRLFLKAINLDIKAKKIEYIDENCNSLHFLISCNGKTDLVKISGYSIQVSKSIFGNEFDLVNFNLAFNLSAFLNKIKEIWIIESFIKRLLVINHKQQTIDLNYKTINYILENSNDFFNIYEDQTEGRLGKLSLLNKLEMEIIEPHISKYPFQDDNKILLESQFRDSLLKSEITTWGEKIIQYILKNDLKFKEKQGKYNNH